MNKRQIDFTMLHTSPLKTCREVIVPPKDIPVLTAKEIMVLLGVGRSTAYNLIKEVRARWPAVHRVLNPGCVSKEYFMRQLYGTATRKEKK